MIKINNIYNNEINKSTNQVKRLDIQEVSINKLGNTVISKNTQSPYKINNKDGKVLKKEDNRLKEYIKRNSSSFDRYA